MSDEQTPQEALASIRETREAVYKHMDKWPWWYDLGYGASTGLLVGGQGLPAVYGAACTAIALGILAFIIRRWTAETGFWVNGYKPKRARWVAFGMAGMFVGLMLVAITFRGNGPAWAPLALGLLAGVLSVIGSRIWMRVYLAETRDLS